MGYGGKITEEAPKEFFVTQAKYLIFEIHEQISSLHTFLILFWVQENFSLLSLFDNYK